VAVDIHLTDDRVLRTSDDTDIVEVTRALSTASEMGGTHFAEISVLGQTRVFVNPASVTYLQVIENQEVALAVN
jgi:hypothetical protein